MEHNYQLQIRSKGNSKVNRNCATAATEWAAQCRLCAQRVWGIEHPEGCRETEQSHLVPMCFKDHNVCFTVITHMFCSVRNTHILHRHTFFLPTWGRLPFSDNVACPQQVWSKEKDPPQKRPHKFSLSYIPSLKIYWEQHTTWTLCLHLSLTLEKSWFKKEKGSIPH